MAKADRQRGRGFGSRLFGLINPIRDPSLLVAVILTVIEQGGSGNPAPVWLLFGVLNWIAVKAIIWLLVNFAFSFVYLLRKTGWVIRNPRLAWRLLDALGTEEIIIGGLRPDMFATEDGALHEGQLGAALGYMAAGYAGALSGSAYGADQPYDDRAGYDDYQGENGYRDYDRRPSLSSRLEEQSEAVRQILSSYEKLIGDWMSFTEEKWRAVSDSQLGWKPLRGRWNGWEEIFRDSFGADDPQALQNALDTMVRRFENAQSKGSAASAVACFLHDLDILHQSLVVMGGGEEAATPRMGGIEQKPQLSQRTNKGPIIRNPMIVDADR
jgi:hypothetical protein